MAARGGARRSLTPKVDKGKLQEALVAHVKGFGIAAALDVGASRKRKQLACGWVGCCCTMAGQPVAGTIL